MEDSQHKSQARLSEFRDGLRRAGVKMTHQRLEIFREAARSSDHPDAETIFQAVRERMPTVSLDTVYRTLWMLVDLGMLNTLGPRRERVRFDANLSPHHHFVCRKCGMTRDFTSDEYSHIQAPDLLKTWGTVEMTQVEVRGVCVRCSEREQMELVPETDKEEET